MKIFRVISGDDVKMKKKTNSRLFQRINFLLWLFIAPFHWSQYTYTYVDSIVSLRNKWATEFCRCFNYVSNFVCHNRQLNGRFQWIIATIFGARVFLFAHSVLFLENCLRYICIDVQCAIPRFHTSSAWCLSICVYCILVLAWELFFLDIEILLLSNDSL